MDAIAYDTRLSDKVTGRLAIPEAKFERVLGPSTYLTWQILCAHRDAGGMTTITYNGMQRAKQFQNLSDRQLANSLNRLRKAGLIQDLAKRRIKMRRPVGRKGKTTVVWCLPRRVYGARAVSLGGAMVLVPGWVWGWIQKAPKWGGARRGAGRPRKKTPFEPSSGGKVDASGAGFGIQGVVWSRKSKCSTDLYTKISRGISSMRDVPSLASQGMAHGVFNAQTDPLFTAKHPADSQENTTSESSQKKTPSELGLKIGGRHTKPPPAAGTLGVPHYPGPRVCPPALVPAPPRLPDDVRGVDAAHWLAKAYRGAVESRYKKRCWVLAGRSKLEKSRYLQLLIDAAELLRQYDVPPAAWTAFSVDNWRKYGIGRGKPNLSWVYNLKRIEDQHSWGRREGYGTRRAVYPKAAQVLMSRYNCMREDLARSGAQTRQEVKVVVDLWFPDDLYERLGRRARERALDDQQHINAAAVRGDWLGW